MFHSTVHVMLVIVVETSRVVSSTHVSLLSVLVDAPDIAYSILNGLIVSISQNKSWSNGPESHILYLELEKS